jgi:hypothetical protein
MYSRTCAIRLKLPYALAASTCASSLWHMSSGVTWRSSDEGSACRTCGAAAKPRRAMIIPQAANRKQCGPLRLDLSLRATPSPAPSPTGPADHQGAPLSALFPSSSSSSSLTRLVPGVVVEGEVGHGADAVEHQLLLRLERVPAEQGHERRHDAAVGRELVASLPG